MRRFRINDKFKKKQHRWRLSRARPTRAGLTACAARKAQWRTARAGCPCTTSRLAAGPSATARPTAPPRWLAATANAATLARARAVLAPIVEQQCIQLFVVVRLVTLGIHLFVVCQVC